MNDLGRTGLALSVVLILGIGGLFWATAGFEALTSETARRKEVQRAPVEIPPAQLLDGTELLEELSSDGRVALVDFVYTRCPTLCRSLGSEYQLLQREIHSRGLEEKVRLITISFDIEHDDSRRLAGYAARLRADPGIWKVTTVPLQNELQQMLQSFGIIVLPTGDGDFVHNAAIHVVTPDGRLHRILDLGQWRQALADALVAAR